MPKPATSISNREVLRESTIQLVVDNSGRVDARQPSAASRPLSWALCLLIWAMLAVAGWGAIGFLLQRI